MARVKKENPLHRKIVLRSVVDGFTITKKDFGSSHKTIAPSVEYSSILRALERKSALDGGPVFRIVEEIDPEIGGVSLAQRLAMLGDKAPRFTAYTKSQMWSAEDDKRLEAHLAHRKERSAGAQEAGIAEAYRQKNNAEMAETMAPMIAAAVAAVKQAEAAAAPEPAPKPKAKPPKSKGAKAPPANEAADAE